jgi:hypothetical protein
VHRYDWGSCEAPNKANIERFTSVLAKCIKKAVDAGKDIAVLAHLDLEKVRYCSHSVFGRGHGA